MKYLFIAFCILFSVKLTAQIPMGNEWIKKDQKYLKIKVSENGIYRITYPQLQALNFLNGDPNAKNLQVFFHGKEIPIYVFGENDQKFDNGDYIEFYGQKNDGELDRILYTGSGTQPNPEVSLYSDESFYFLTVSPQPGKRYSTPTNRGTGLSPEPYLMYTASANFAETYYPGKYLIDVMTLSEFIDGEGYLGTTFSLGATQNRTLRTPNLAANAGIAPVFSYYVAGRSDAANTNANGFNHHLSIKIGSTEVVNQSFRGYAIVSNNTTITGAILNEVNTISFSSIADLGAVTDFQAPAYARITYPRTFEANSYNELSFNLSSQTTTNLLRFTNTTWTNPVLLDPENGYRYTGISGSAVDFTISNPQRNKLIVYSENAIKTPIVETQNFNVISASSSNANLLIVTHQSLLASANEYSAYQASKGFSPLVVTTEELYNQFYYGQHHPLAIKNFCRYLLTNAARKPEYLLLLGKGFETPKNNLNNDLVPTMGFPASDAFLTSGILDNNMAPSLATGRIPAKTNDEVLIYLDKLKAYNQQPDSIWRKNIINISGGANSAEDVSFSAYLNGFSAVAKQEFFGAKTINYYKSVTDPITNDLTTKINTSINNGVGLLSFLGHGSTVSTAVSIGNPINLNNANKLLVYLINGCSTGNAFTSGSLGENYIFQKNKGAIGWIGTSSEGVASYLANFTSLFYQNSFNSSYGRSISQNLLAAGRAYQNPSDDLNKAHLKQYTFLGDPTIAFYAPNKPDYEINSTDIGFVTPNVTSGTANFQLFAIVRNSGKAITDNVAITLTRTLPDNSVINYPAKNFSKLFNTDTLVFDVDNAIANVGGNHKFSIRIDPQNKIDELSKTNNTAELTYFMPSNGVTLISPANFGIINKADTSLTLQINNLSNTNAEVTFEIDTLQSFTSGWKRNSGIIQANLFASWKPTAILENGKVYYWRAKLNSTNPAENVWQTGSFSYLQASADGWRQGHYQQYTTTGFKNIYLNPTSKKFEYTPTAYPVLVRTRGKDSPQNSERRIRVSVSVGALAFNGPDFQGVSLVALSATNSRNVFNYPSPYNFKNDPATSSGQFFFNTNNQVDLDSLKRYISNIPNNYYVIGMSGLNFSPKDLPQDIKNAFQSLGLIAFQNVGNGEPYAFWGKKGAAPGSAFEKTADYTAATPATQQNIDFSYDLMNPFNSGQYISEKIGPAKKWSEVDIDLSTSNGDNVSYNLIGVNQNGVETVLKSNLSTPKFSLSDVPASEFPYLRLNIATQDDVNQSVANLNSWKVIYDAYPDCSFNPAFVNSFYSKTLQEGDSLKVSVGLTNLEKTISDSVLVSYRITKSDRSVISGLAGKTAPLVFKGNDKISFSLPTVGLAGSNVLLLNLKPKDQKDKLEFNNNISYNFTVTGDQKEPIVDVLFDNKRIINGEIVSPQPQILISLLDENKFLLLKDTSNVEVYLKHQSDQTFKRIAFSSNQLTMQSAGTATNNKIAFNFLPAKLNDGTYTLRVKSKDASGNTTKANDYNIDFEVVNQQAITNFLPYPNPFTTSMRFVFQVTGKIPDKIKVQIMTITGKIVREIFKNDLGPIQIGNNISTFTWDGTDQFGDRLANGVYFYHVITENDDQSEIKHRSNASDTFFKKNFGKIYLMR